MILGEKVISGKVVLNLAAPVCINGAFHWLGEYELPRYMNSLNLVTLMYEKVPMPRCDTVGLRHFSLGVFRGCLCLLYKCNIKLDVRMMNDCGIKESWNKYACIMDVENYSFDKPLPLDVVFVMNYGSALKLYDSSAETPNFHENSFIDRPYLEAVTYIESLVLSSFNHEGYPLSGQ
ncbi:unnamed protein product [Fraxinus pennsylvanica]|uniref:Uncharacterized protein n=1 Tax=Fraxinus pennsylvanica TaxID=56036 RepID=A0AAD2E330_9LAMI|nr:unnamed protein product [Fraxinus pennsylvanica]